MKTKEYELTTEQLQAFADTVSRWRKAHKLSNVHMYLVAALLADDLHQQLGLGAKSSKIAYVESPEVDTPRDQLN